MKSSKITILLLAVVISLALSSMCISAEETTDETGDVYHHKYTENDWSWEPSIESKANIDISKVSYTANKSTLTLTFEVNGEIEDSRKVVYMLYYNTTDAVYMFTYTNGTGVAMGTLLGGGFDFSQGNFTASGNTLTATIDLLGRNTVETVWGFATEYSEDPQMIENPNVVEWWGDWIPGTYAPWYTGEKDTNGEGDTDSNDGEDSAGGIPGFETITFVVAFAIMFILLKKK